MRLLPNPLRVRRLRALRRNGDRAMRLRDWTGAASWYGKVLAIEPIAGIQIQHGHALRESGDLAAAERAYAAVPDDAPEAIQARFYRARIHEMLGDRATAAAGYAAIVQDDPGHREAYARLIQAGGRELLADELRMILRDRTAAGLEESVRVLQGELASFGDISTYPPSAYDDFRRAFPVRPPPSGSITPGLTVLIDAVGTAPCYLRATLLSLIDQTVRDWHAVVLTDTAIADHSIASIAAADDRIAILTTPPSDLVAPFLHLDAGTILDMQALAWFAFSHARTGAKALWCDHDHALETAAGMLRYSRPRLWGVFDVDLMRETWSPPAAVLIDSDAMPPIGGEDGPQWRRAALLAAGERGPVATIPRILATTLGLAERARGAPQGTTPIRLWSTMPDGARPAPDTPEPGRYRYLERGHRTPLIVPRPERPEERIQIIIPTRDAADMLRASVESLLDTASDPDRLDLVIVDNRSRMADTKTYLDTLAKRPRTTVLPLDEPFNWSRANNLAARLSTAETIVFANNDIEMRSAAWDDHLLGYVQRPDTGIVGARMLYPDGSIQHAGILFGIAEGGPLHHGAREVGDVAGPLGRFDHSHAVSATTGAFLGIGRPLFDRLGGFDEIRFAIAYNDVDLCLAARALGYTILYAPAIELVHHESKTRGIDVTRDRVAWDLSEFSSLRARWGASLFRDPSYNPHWSRNRPYDGLREPGLREILDAIDRGGRADPWRTEREPDDARSG